MLTITIKLILIITIVGDHFFVTFLTASLIAIINKALLILFIFKNNSKHLIITTTIDITISILIIFMNKLKSTAKINHTV